MSLSEIDVDNFAGGGGATEGIEGATGRPVTIAINHCRDAIAMHEANHPETRHYQEDVWEVDPREAAAGRRVRRAWFSPDCTHHSRAKGGAPRESGRRGLAWVAIRWARTVRPDVIFLENVEEFEEWGPLLENGKPDKTRKGETFKAFVAALISHGYEVQWRRIVAADHGAPTTRRRLFMIARRDRKPIVWPEETHGEGRARSWRTAAEIIDWSLPTRSIFGRSKPLADATMRRIAAGLKRYVIESASPFIVPVTHTKGGDRVHGIDQPLRTVTTAKGGEFALVTPFVSTQFGQSVGRGVDAPVATITGGGMGHHSLVAPVLVQTGYGERKGQKPRALDLHKPLGTVVRNQKHALVSAFLTRHYGDVFKQDLDAPMATVTCREHFTAQTVELAPVAEAAWLETFHGRDVGVDARDPLPTVTATGTHLAEVRAFLVKYYGDSDTQRQRCDRPLDAVTTRARFGLVTVAGVDYRIVDIGLRMLQPRELFNAQGFPEDYIIDVTSNGHALTKAEKIELCGNSVCPDVARAIVGANSFERYEPRAA